MACRRVVEVRQIGGRVRRQITKCGSNVLYLVTMVEKSLKTTVEGTERLKDVADLVVGRSRVANSR